MTSNAPKLVFRAHAVRRMFERGICEEDASEVTREGEVIEDYPEDTPYPSCLMLAWVGNRPLHVVAAHNSESEELYVVTVYEPDRQR